MKTTNWFSGVLLSIFLLWSPSPSSQNSTQATASKGSELCYIENKTFKGGEELTYKVYYNWNFIWLAAGEVTFKVNDLGQTYVIKADGNTYNSYEWFFKLDDHYSTTLDKNSMLPTVFERDVNEGKVRFYEKIVFDQTNRTATTYHGDNSINTKKYIKSLDGCMHDMMSILYYTRNLDFDAYKANENIGVKIFLDREIWPLNVQYKGRNSNLKLHGQSGQYNSIKFKTQVVAGNVFKENTSMSVYVSDDSNRIPLLIESPVSVGSIKAVLKNYKGLKYDFEAKR